MNAVRAFADTPERGCKGWPKRHIEAPHANDGALKEISWDEFFEKFDENGLALVYQEQTVEGAESNFNKLIHPDDDDHPAAGKTAKKTVKKSAKKSAKKPAKNASKKSAGKASGR